MQFQLAFIATLLVVLYAGNVDALPAKRGAGMVSLPLRRVQQLKRDVHPHIVSVASILGEQRLTEIYTADAATYQPESAPLRTNDWTRRAYRR